MLENYCYSLMNGFGNDIFFPIILSIRFLDYYLGLAESSFKGPSFYISINKALQATLFFLQEP